MSKLKEGWEKMELGELAEEIRKTYEPTPNESLKYIGLEHIEQNSLKLSGIGESSSTQSTKKVFNSNDILFGSLRPYFRKVVKPRFSGVCSTDITVIKSKENCHQGFLFYFIASQDFIDFATNISSGTRMPRANWKVLSKSEWLFPPYETQRKIATILSAYDDLIENNNRRIQVLEEMAQTVYKEWFVKFRFPGHENVKMVDSGNEFGIIPEGWEVKKFDEIFNIKYGKSLPIKKVSKSGRYPVYGAADIIGYYNEYVCQNKVALVTCRGNGSGDVRRTREPAFITNNSLMVFPKKKYSYWEYFFVELVLRNSNIMSIIGGSAQPQITIEGISTVKAIIPEKESITAFCNLIRPMIDYVDSIYYKNSTLRHTRDLLLPKLISGEIDVSDLDIEVDSEKMG